MKRDRDLSKLPSGEGDQSDSAKLIEGLNSIVNIYHRIINSSGDSIALFSLIRGVESSDSLTIALDYCNDEFFEMYGPAFLTSSQQLSETLSQYERISGFFPKNPKVEVDVLLSGAQRMNSASSFPINEQLIQQLKICNNDKLHMYNENRNKITNTVIVPVSENASEFVISQRDTSDLFGLLRAMTAWGDSPPSDVPEAIVDAFKPSGSLGFFGLSFCRLWRYVPDLARFRSVAEFGLTTRAHRAEFMSGGVVFTQESDWIFHAVEVGEPAIYREVDESFPEGKKFRQAHHAQGFPYYETTRWVWPAALEVNGLHSWVDAPLVIGDKVLGCLSISVPKKLNSATWQLLRIACHSAAASLRRAHLQEERNSWLDGVQHNLNTSITGVTSLINTAIYKLTEDPNDPECVSDALYVLKQAMAAEDVIRRQRAKFHFGMTGEDSRTFTREQEDLTEKVYGAVFSLRKQLEKCHISYISDVDSFVTYTDHNEVLDIVRELIYNAVEGPSGSDGATEVWVSLLEKPNSPNMFIRIEDNGPGISPDIIPKLFERKLYGSRKSTGTGVGLNKCFVTAAQLGIALSHDENTVDGWVLVLRWTYLCKPSRHKLFVTTYGSMG